MENTMTSGSINSVTASDCPICQGTGFKSINNQASPCECTIERRIAASLPARYRKANLKDFRDDISAFAKQWTTNPGNGLLIVGMPGTGKTHLAAAILRFLAEARTQVTFLRSAQFFCHIRDTYRRDISEETVLQPLTEIKFLLLDDLGGGSLTDHERRFTLELIDRRLNDNLPTVVTTNWNLGRISQTMDDRIASRLSGFLSLKLSGDDWRQTQTAPRAQE
jgi:DNA replication protein DnaC